MNQQDTRLYVFKRDKWRCRRCGKQLSSGQPQLAHVIKQSKYNVRKYGKEIIHHHENLRAVESLKCNSYFDLGCKDELIKEHVEKIKKIIESEKKLDFLV